MIRLKARLCAAFAIAFMLQACTPKECCYVDYIPPTCMSSINIIDRNGMSETISSKDRLKKYEDVDWLSTQPYQKVLRVYIRDSIGDIHAYITSYYENGLPKQYLEVVNARAKGTYLEWHENGIRKLKATVIGGEADLTEESQKTWLFSGLSEVWSEGDALEAQFNYLNGLLEGDSLYFHANGQVWKRVSFCQGNMHGQFLIYLDNCQLFQSTTYVEGKKNGVSHRYWPAGNLAFEEIYCNDLLQSGSYWDSCGNLICQVKDWNGTKAIFGKETVMELQDISKGVVEGKVKFLGTQGEVLRICHVKDDLKHGEEIEFYRTNLGQGTPKPQISIQWWEGKIQGVTKSWYSNGVQESQREMSGNKKNGVLTAWYQDGALMLMEEYDQDKLVRGEYYKKGDRIPVSEVKDGTGTAMLYDSEGYLLYRVNYVKGIIE